MHTFGMGKRKRSEVWWRLEPTTELLRLILCNYQLLREPIGPEPPWSGFSHFTQNSRRIQSTRYPHPVNQLQLVP